MSIHLPLFRSASPILAPLTIHDYGLLKTSVSRPISEQDSPLGLDAPLGAKAGPLPRFSVAQSLAEMPMEGGK
ncbi:hypothetical protein GQ607_013286 [Colletotrichum asianum]|uniref:Uncharacterized protein n=1 Tax=Colletotrichum asianum TaxID=702518 RepID=A0A8H3W560_9PEZI|nr:hypothetical protein GQ607_013286 [Colletotrichum asianum]